MLQSFFYIMIHEPDDSMNKAIQTQAFGVIGFQIGSIEVTASKEVYLYLQSTNVH